MVTEVIKCPYIINKVYIQKIQDNFSNYPNNNYVFSQFKSHISIHLPKQHFYTLKGYKLYDVVTKKIFVSRDVVFHE